MSLFFYDRLWLELDRQLQAIADLMGSREFALQIMRRLDQQFSLVPPDRSICASKLPDPTHQVEMIATQSSDPSSTTKKENISKNFSNFIYLPTYLPT